MRGDFNAFKTCAVVYDFDVARWGDYDTSTDEVRYRFTGFCVAC